MPINAAVTNAEHTLSNIVKRLSCENQFAPLSLFK